LSHVTTRELTNQDHHAVTTVLSIEAEVEDQDLHHQDTTTAHGMKEAKDLNLQSTHTTAKTMKRRWERHALLAEFAGALYPKDSSYPMISRNTTDLRNHDHGFQTIYKQ
jgi:hypothetical protein